ncbi:hypothetical protein AB0M25_22215 [Streptomyces griseomycini]|uniref:hypothetical protein n=1 Tax=Streptomyces griseomycini TaxID=66895 RepID=UPI0034243E41
MKITVTVEEPTDAFRSELLELLGRHAAAVEVDADWTPERAERYYHALPPRAARIIREAAQRGGYVPADALREDGKGLRGHSGPLTTTLLKGVKEGWLPQGIEQPLIYHGPGYGPVAGYQLRDDVRDFFALAVVRTLADGKPGPGSAG